MSGSAGNRCIHLSLDDDDDDEDVDEDEEVDEDVDELDVESVFFFSFFSLGASFCRAVSDFLDGSPPLGFRA